jgi:hypothetical protein
VKGLITLGLVMVGIVGATLVQPIGEASSAASFSATGWVAAAGDIACAVSVTARDPGTCHEDATGYLLSRSNSPFRPVGTSGLRAILPLGDLQYESGTLAQFTATSANCKSAPTFVGTCSFDGSWGAAKRSLGSGAVWQPVVGNHEYRDTATNCTRLPVVDGKHACGMENYFGPDVAAPDAVGTGSEPIGDGLGDYYVKYNANKAHPVLFIGLNTGPCTESDHAAAWCTNTSSPGPASFLRSTLQDNSINPDGACVVVYFHQPRWSAYYTAGATEVDPEWTTMFDAVTGAKKPDLVLNGHAHNYQRYDPLSRAGGGAPQQGIREIIVGTGGRNTFMDQKCTPGTTGCPAPVKTDFTKFGVGRLVWDSTSGQLRFQWWVATDDGTLAANPADSLTWACR